MDYHQPGIRRHCAYHSNQVYYFKIQGPEVPFSCSFSIKGKLYNLQQFNSMTNQEYLKQFLNLVDSSTAYEGQSHDQAIVVITTKLLHPAGVH